MRNETFDALFQAAQKARAHSYAPISNFNVGAAFLTATRKIYAGTNVEEAAFNSSIHAEQGAIAQMVAAEGRARITHLVVIGGKPGDGMACIPCGHCRQLLVEFAGDDLEIAAAGPDGDIRLETTLGELLPHAFRLSNILDH
jgi:cytidine deaminase